MAGIMMAAIVTAGTQTETIVATDNTWRGRGSGNLPTRACVVIVLSSGADSGGEVLAERERREAAALHGSLQLVSGR
jgi:hypothetical protein